MWTEILSGVGLSVGLLGFYGGMYKLGWECSKREQIKKLEFMIKSLDDTNKDLINQYEQHIENLKNHRIRKGLRLLDEADKVINEVDELSEKLK